MDKEAERKLAAYSHELRAIQAQAGELKRAETKLKSLIADEVGKLRGTIKANGAPVLDITYGKKFDPALAATVLASNPELLEACTETVISSTKAKQILPPAVYELCQRENDAPTIKPAKVSA